MRWISITPKSYRPCHYFPDENPRFFGWFHFAYISHIDIYSELSQTHDHKQKTENRHTHTHVISFDEWVKKRNQMLIKCFNFGAIKTPALYMCIRCVRACSFRIHCAVRPFSLWIFSMEEIYAFDIIYSFGSLFFQLLKLLTRQYNKCVRIQAYLPLCELAKSVTKRSIFLLIIK